MTSNFLDHWQYAQSKRFFLVSSNKFSQEFVGLSMEFAVRPTKYYNKFIVIVTFMVSDDIAMIMSADESFYKRFL